VPDRQGGEVNKVDKGPGKCGWMQAGSGLRRNVNLVDSVNFVYVEKGELKTIVPAPAIADACV
jgi:hypothetical protein